MDNNTSVIIDLAGRYAAAYGIVRASEMMSKVVLTKEENKYDLTFFDDFNDEDETIKLVYGEIEMIFGTMLSGDSSSVFAPPMMLFFRREKDFIETETNGDDNVIVERWATRPWEIQMQGLLIDVEGRKYPSNKITELHKLFKINDRIEVIGKQFVEKDIYNIFFRDISITPLEGFGDTIQFDFSATAFKEVPWSLIEPDL